MRLRVLASVGVLGLFVLGLESIASAQIRRPHECAPMAAVLGVTPTAPGGTSLGDFPVYVHYMVNVDNPGDDPSTSLTVALLQSYLAAAGPFNAVWSDQGITLVLVGVEQCTYSLKKFGYTAERRNFPNPEADRALPLKIFKRYNARYYQVGTGSRSFKGLDLYIWWNIQNASGYGSSPKFGAHGITTKGGAFLDRDCLNEPVGPNGLVACGRAFAHEVGHFFALCHCCTTDPDPNHRRQWPTCTTTYCSDVVIFPGDVAPCDSSTADRLMASNWANTLLSPCEVTRATQYAQQILNQ